MIVQPLLGFAAGGLSLLAPCVLPLLPMILASSLRSSRFGPVMMALGLAVSFAVFGVLTTVFARLFDADHVRNVGAGIMVVAGIFFVVPQLKDRLSEFLSRASSAGDALQRGLRGSATWKEFLGGALLGMIWSPCTGPTLGLAIGLASQSKEIVPAVAVFVAFGLGAGTGLLLLGVAVSRLQTLRGLLLNHGATVQAGMGIFAIMFGLAVLTGVEATVQEWLLSILPTWLIEWTVRI